MLDVSNLASNPKVNKQIFSANYYSGAAVNWVTWVKPRGINFIYIVAVGGGGGGGGGFAGAIGATTSGGGGGGGSAANSVALFPAWALPDILYLAVGPGGAGGAVSTAGSAGLNTYIAIFPSTAANNLIITCNAGLGGGAAAAGGAAGAVGAATSVSSSCLGSLGVMFLSVIGSVSIPGKLGTGGYSNGSRFPVGIEPSNSLTAGGGGGGGFVTSTNNSGGYGDSFNSYLFAANAAAGGSPTSIVGENGDSGGLEWTNLLTFTCGGGGGGAGCGASASVANSGGRGGNGGPGCGGGGGGGGFTGSTGGRGGNGGDGLVIIMSW